MQSCVTTTFYCMFTPLFLIDLISLYRGVALFLICIDVAMCKTRGILSFRLQAALAASLSYAVPFWMDHVHNRALIHHSASRHSSRTNRGLTLRNTLPRNAVKACHLLNHVGYMRAEFSRTCPMNTCVIQHKGIDKALTLSYV